MNDYALARGVEHILSMRLELLQERTCYHHCLRGKHIISMHKSCDDKRCAAIERHQLSRILVCLKCTRDDRNAR